MSLIAMAVYDTEENKRTAYTRKAINCLLRTVDHDTHRLIIVDNGSCKATLDLYKEYIAKDAGLNMANVPMVVYLNENRGTAKAINQAWLYRNPGEHCIKVDSDIVINGMGWIEDMERAVAADPLIGQVGLKRKDCWERPDHEGADWRSTLHMLPHVPGERWQIVEKVKHVIGSCVMHSSALLDKVGYLYQPSLYGYDDVIMSHRSYIAGFYSCFLPHIDIDHIDDGTTPYQGWKEKHSSEQTAAVIKLVHEMRGGQKSIYYEADY